MTRTDPGEVPPPGRESLRLRATYWGYRTVWGIAAGLPEPLAWRVPPVAGALWHRLGSPSQRDQVRRNLARVTGHAAGSPELEEVVRAAYRSYARYWLEAFRLHRMSAGYVLDRSTGDGLEHIDAFRDSGRGGILATAHLGSWDVGAFFTRQRDWRLTAVAEVLEPRRLFDRFVRLRRAAGLEVIPLVRGGDMIGRLERVIRDGGIATLLADRDLTRKGPVVEFFGEPCRLPPGPAVLARRTGRPVAVGAFVTLPRGWKAVVRPPIDVSHLSVEAGTQAIAHELQALIGAYPEQWHVFVRNWLADREPDHPALADRGA